MYCTSKRVMSNAGPTTSTQPINPNPPLRLTTQNLGSNKSSRPINAIGNIRACFSGGAERERYTERERESVRVQRTKKLRSQSNPGAVLFFSPVTRARWKRPPRRPQFGLRLRPAPLLLLPRRDATTRPPWPTHSRPTAAPSLRSSPRKMMLGPSASLVNSSKQQQVKKKTRRTNTSSRESRA